MTHYAGLDVSLRSVAICIIDAEGHIQLETSVPSEVEDIAQVLEGFQGKISSVGLEAGVQRPIHSLWNSSISKLNPFAFKSR